MPAEHATESLRKGEHNGAMRRSGGGFYLASGVVKKQNITSNNAAAMRPIDCVNVVARAL
jgi:hypothetical protein